MRTSTVWRAWRSAVSKLVLIWRPTKQSLTFVWSYGVAKSNQMNSQAMSLPVVGSIMWFIAARLHAA